MVGSGLGAAGTPRETTEVSNSEYFGDPIYTYSLRQGINDGFLAPYRVVRVGLNIDLEGWRPPKGYLDKYSIRESVADGTTVPLHYQLAPNDLLVDRETLEAKFLSLAEAEGLSDVEELNAILDGAVELKEMMKMPIPWNQPPAGHVTRR